MGLTYTVLFFFYFSFIFLFFVGFGPQFIADCVLWATNRPLWCLSKMSLSHRHGFMLVSSAILCLISSTAGGSESLHKIWIFLSVQYRNHHFNNRSLISSLNASHGAELKKQENKCCFPHCAKYRLWRYLAKLQEARQKKMIFSVLRPNQILRNRTLPRLTRKRNGVE